MPSSRQKATRPGALIARHRRLRVVVDPGMRARLSLGNREISVSPRQRALGRSGRPEAAADDDTAGEVGHAHSTDEAGEQSGDGRGGGRGGKGWDQGECGRAKHGPDTEPGSRAKALDRIREAVNRNRQGEVHGAPASHHLDAFARRSSRLKRRVRRVSMG